MDLLAKPAAMRPNSAFDVKKALESLADPLSAALKTPPPSIMSPNAFDQLADSLQRSSGHEAPASFNPEHPDMSWGETDHTPIVDASLPSISIGWYLLPISLFALLIYLITAVFK